MATYKAVLNNKPKADGTNTIMIRVTEERKHKYFSSGYSVKHKDWNPSPRKGNDDIPQFVRKSHPKHKIINKEIDNKISEIRGKIESLQVKTPSNIKRAVKGDAKSDSFIKFYEQHVDYLGANPQSYGTWKGMRSKLKKLKSYLNEEDITFDEIDRTFLDGYREHLYGIGNGVNTVSRNLQDIGSVLKLAIIQGKAKQEKNPFFTYKLERKKKMKTVLNDEDFKALVNLSLKEYSLIWHIRNYFLLGFYLHGIRVGDFIQLKFSNFENGRLIYEMDKTNTVMSIKITDKAKTILGHYLNDKSSKSSNYVFPLLSRDKDYSDTRYLKQQIESKTALVNTYLKKLAKKAEINKNISFHVSRHSFASYARDVLENIYHVQKLLGHKDIKVTQEYLSELPSTKLDQVSDLLFEQTVFS